MDDTPDQLRAIQTDDRNLQIIACAGSGKTQVISERIVHTLRTAWRVDAYFENDHRIRLRCGGFQTRGYYNPQQQEHERVEVL